MKIIKFSGLMDKEEFSKLGFTEEISWENEEAEKKALYDKIHQMKKKAEEQYKLREEFKRAQENK